MQGTKLSYSFNDYATVVSKAKYEAKYGKNICFSKY